jgi:hypothetical protein
MQCPVIKRCGTTASVLPHGFQKEVPVSQLTSATVNLRENETDAPLAITSGGEWRLSETG